MTEDGPIAQLGYVVDDISLAMDHWVRTLGVGPFYYLPEPPLFDLRYKGEEIHPRVAIGLAYSGDMQVELIDPLDDGPSPYRDFQAVHGHGLHHVARFVDDYDAAFSALAAQGRRPCFEGRGMNAGQRFSYFESPSSGPVYEIVEVPGFRAFFEHIRNVSAAWDGSDPVRTVAL
jgi:catechol 2,3-dioxygenase-like lactoylglutathione lyase family enzyme